MLASNLSLATLSVANELPHQVFSWRRRAAKELSEIVRGLPYHIQLQLLIPRPLLLPRRRRGEEISRFNSPRCKITTNRKEQKLHFESAIQYQICNSPALAPVFRQTTAAKWHGRPAHVLTGETPVPRYGYGRI